MQRSAITFDFHNTLFACDAWFQLEIRDLVPAFLSWFERQGGDHDSALSAEQGRRLYGDLRSQIKRHGVEQDAASCVATVVDWMGLDIPARTVEEGVHAVMAAVPNAEPMAGASETVRALVARRIPLGIVSSAVYTPFLTRSLRQHGMDTSFVQVTTSASAGYYKTRPELFWHAATAMGVPAGNILHVGDSLPFDIGGSQRAGFRSAWLSHGRTRADDAPQPDLTLPDLVGAADRLSELLEYALIATGPRV